MSGQGTERVIGVDVGGSKILAGFVDRAGALEQERERTTPCESQEDLLAGLDAVVEGLLSEGDAAAIGFGLPSRIDQRAGRALASVNIPLAELDFRDRMAQRFGLPVGIDNDANAAAIAEWKIGAGKGARYMVMLTLGTGIGGGLILDGRPYRGSIGAGAELGHMVLDHAGAACGCGGHGHFETLASGSAVGALARATLGAGADGRELVRRARDGDEKALEALTEIGHRLGAGIASLVNIFDPELVVLGGGLGTVGELLFAPAREHVAREALPPTGELVRIVPAALGVEAGVIGAGFVAFEALDSAAAREHASAG